MTSLTDSNTGPWQLCVQGERVMGGDSAGDGERVHVLVVVAHVQGAVG
jgi:hypothetical protein